MILTALRENMVNTTSQSFPHDSGDYRGADIKAVAILFLILSWISVSLRCYVRIYMMKLFRIDDWLAVATLVVFTLYAVFVLLGAAAGTGRHFGDISDSDYSTAMMWWYCGEITYVLTTCLLKITIGVFLTQVCVKKFQINIIRIVIIVFSIFTTYFLFLMIFQCHPIHDFWTQLTQDGNCISRGIIANSTYAHGALSAVADWILGIIPIFIVWNLKMNPRTKISVALILALGAVGSTATVIRMPYIWQIGAGNDFLFQNTDVSIWSTVEPGMGITASSMACLRPLFQAFLSRSRLFGSSNHGVSVWVPQRSGYVRNGTSGGTEAHHLHRNSARTSHGAPSAGDDLEGGAVALEEREGSTLALNEGDGWEMTKRSMTDESSDEIKRYNNSKGASVVHDER